MSSDPEEDAEAKSQRLKSSLGASGSADDTLDQRRSKQMGGSSVEGKVKGKQVRGGKGVCQTSQEELRDLAAALGEDDDLGRCNVNASATMNPPGIVQVASCTVAATAKILRDGLFSGEDRIISKNPAGKEAVDFVPAKAFSGSRHGMVFRKGAKGLGYYLDVTCHSAGGGSGKSASGVAIAGGGTAGGGTAVAVHKVLLAGIKQHQQRQKGLGEGVSEDLYHVDVDQDRENDGEDGPLTGSREGMRPAPSSKAVAQNDLISMAFAGM